MTYLLTFPLLHDVALLVVSDTLATGVFGHLRIVDGGLIRAVSRSSTRRPFTDLDVLPQGFAPV
jgi:hypothetical protein